ncbi:MAG: hypothetical protein COB02_13745 [Candidatus Cloacimonadota bacterium]|nr:MAG: hypothetical protein COB02_13745 [Candidatus Cloacimonadota bacterium]
MDWDLYIHTFLLKRVEELKSQVIKVKLKSDKQSFEKHPSVKLLKSISCLMKTEIPLNPNNKNYFLGNTLGKENSSFRRAKKGLPERYRLFFKFFSEKKSIFYLWLNDEKSLRRSGHKTDVYNIFSKLIKRKDISKSHDELLTQSNHFNS